MKPRLIVHLNSALAASFSVLGPDLTSCRYSRCYNSDPPTTMDTATRMEPPKDKRALEKLERIAGLTVARRKQPCLVDSDGREIPLPEQLFGLIVKVAGDLQAGRSVFVISGEQAMTPQAAADFLGMSRQFLSRLMDEGALPFHSVGSHRRLLFKDIQKFATKRAQSRRATMEKLRDKLYAARVVA